MIIQLQGGVHIEGAGKYILLDPTSRPPKLPAVVLLTHAHRDHYSPSVLRFLRKVPIVMSIATRRLVDPHFRLTNVIEMEPGEEVEVSGLSIQAHEAGHIIGSLQFSFELKNFTFTYTGDFNLEKRVVLQPASIVKSDVLIIDATYGSPLYDFPPRGELYTKLVKMLKEEVEAGGRVLLKGRQLGVAQEITSLVNLSMRIPPVVEEAVAKYNRIYEDFGELIGDYVSSSAITTNSSIMITGLGTYSRRFSKIITCTGWAIRKGVPISSHADYAQITEYVLRSEASVVIPFVGFRKALAEILKSRYGIESSWSDRTILEKL